MNGDYRGLRFTGTTLDGIVYNCKLGGADFSGTTLNGAVFEQISDFADSKWGDNANWWDADGLSCGLAHYLDSRYPPAKAENHEKAKILGEQLPSSGIAASHAGSLPLPLHSIYNVGEFPTSVAPGHTRATKAR